MPLPLPRLFAIRHATSNDSMLHLMAADRTPTKAHAIRRLRLKFDPETDFLPIEEKALPAEMVAAIEKLIAGAKKS